MTKHPHDDAVARSKTRRAFCIEENLSPSTYAKMRREGTAPRELQIPGTRISRITEEAHQEWRQMMENYARSTAARLEEARRAVQCRQAGNIAAKSPLHVSKRNTKKSGRKKVSA